MNFTFVLNEFNRRVFINFSNCEIVKKKKVMINNQVIIFVDIKKALYDIWYKFALGIWLMEKLFFRNKSFCLSHYCLKKKYFYFQEFLDGDDSELVELAKSILIHPESGALALPLFNPNRSCIDNFLSLYRTLTSSVGKHSPNTLLALFSKVSYDKYSKFRLIGRKTILTSILAWFVQIKWLSQLSEAKLMTFSILFLTFCLNIAVPQITIIYCIHFTPWHSNEKIMDGTSYSNKLNNWDY